MNTLKNKDAGFLNNFIVFYFLLVFTLWLKTYLTQTFLFDVGADGALQNFLLFINPIGSAMLFLGFAFLFKGRKKYIALMVVYTLLSVLLYGNVLHYREFTDYLTLPTLFQTSNFGSLGGSILPLLSPIDPLYFIDVIIIIALLAFKVIKVQMKDNSRRKVAAVISLALGISCLNLGIAESDRPQLLTRGFDRNYIVKYLGLYNYTIFDAVETTKASAQKALADSDDVVEIINFTKSNYAEPNEKYFGFAKDMNVVYIHLESIQEFLIDYQLNGEEVTPFLNSLKEHENTIFFDNFFHQVALGKTADAEFMIENSLFGLSQGAAFFQRGTNTYQAAPGILKDHGYTSAVFHGNNGSFWNRNQIYKSFGYDRFYDINYYDVKPEDTAQYGLMDKPFFEQSIPYLEELPQPFYSKFITVSHHHPYSLDQNLATIDKHTTGDSIVDGYFQTARYADESLEQFFNAYKEAGLYDNTIFIMYGDHYGISDSPRYLEPMEKVIGEEVTPFVSAGLQRVPLYIHAPGLEGGINHTYGGQIDLLPTLMHLLGIETNDYIQFGTDLLSKDHSELVPFRNGDYVSPEFYAINGNYYDTATGLELAEDDPRIERAQEYKAIVENKLNMSDNVVNGDLLRFHTPEGFVPVDPSIYNYSTVENE